MPLNVQSGTVEFTTYMSEIWQDPGLNFENMNACDSNVTATSEIFSRVWMPKMNFIDSIEAKFVHSPFPNEYVLIFYNGTIRRSFRCSYFASIEFKILNFIRYIF